MLWAGGQQETVDDDWRTHAKLVAERSEDAASHYSSREWRASPAPNADRTLQARGVQLSEWKDGDVFKLSQARLNVWALHPQGKTALLRT